jgi:hypothetical protein
MAFFIGPLLGGWVYQAFGAQVLWAACLVVGLSLCLAYIALGRLAHALHHSAAALATED